MLVVPPKLHRRWMLPKIGFRARDEKNVPIEKRRFPLQQKMERYQWKSLRRGTSPTSPGCHRSLNRGSESGKREYIKRLLKNPLPDTRCRRSWSWSHRPPGHPSAVPSPAGSRDSPALAAAMRPERSRPGMRRRRRGAGGGRCTPRGARLMLCSTCPRQGTPQPPHGEKMRCRCLPPWPGPGAQRRLATGMGAVGGNEGQ